MSDGYLNIISGTSGNVPKLDPNAPAGPTGPSGPSGYPTGATGANGVPGSSHYNNYPGGGGGSASCTPNSGSGKFPNVTVVSIPYTGWFYNINIQANPTTEKVKVKNQDGRDGCNCVKCEQFYPFAEPNQEDGTLICFSCRNGY